MGTAQISGVVLYLAHKHNLPVVMHTPTEVKAAVSGSGRAAKAQVGAMVAKILNLTEVPKPADSADSLAIAICSAWKLPTSTQPTSATKAQARWNSAVTAPKKKDWV
jgi:crossover junction endodeoxyribonuclease RuvC